MVPLPCLVWFGLVSRDPQVWRISSKCISPLIHWYPRASIPCIWVSKPISSFLKKYVWVLFLWYFIFFYIVYFVIFYIYSVTSWNCRWKLAHHSYLFSGMVGFNSDLPQIRISWEGNVTSSIVWITLTDKGRPTSICEAPFGSSLDENRALLKEDLLPFATAGFCRVFHIWDSSAFAVSIVHIVSVPLENPGWYSF